ncbi:chorismate synthase [Roseibium sp. TrichSKD4]|uniref:hypothetical protein n=1 Tax=Roseibium sp. TrichSKD4 TaxID=744980 RepID=UPI0001E56C8D|nr:hypothetical protein [Roseibium sp. TrichSKD4]EFO33197.1 chorismate synthase [Roseibium sp. TrichSKD4]
MGKKTQPLKDYDVCSTAPMATIRIGPHSFLVDRKRFEDWERQLNASVGFARDDVIAEIKGRLGID